jgi:hypothetical protein
MAATTRSRIKAPVELLVRKAPVRVPPREQFAAVEADRITQCQAFRRGEPLAVRADHVLVGLLEFENVHPQVGLGIDTYPILIHHEQLIRAGEKLGFHYPLKLP